MNKHDDVVTAYASTCPEKTLTNHSHRWLLVSYVLLQRKVRDHGANTVAKTPTHEQCDDVPFAVLVFWLLLL